jgi:hypothetical protein
LPDLWNPRLDEADFDTAVKDAVMDGPPGEVLLIEALPKLPGHRRTRVIAVLGDAQGPRGIHALRTVLAEAGLDTDSTCAALLALAKRAGVDASADLAAHLAHASGSVRGYAILGLAVVGDDRARTQALSLLIRTLDRPIRGYGQKTPMRSGHGLFDAMMIIT